MNTPTILVDGAADIVHISNGDTVVTIPVRMHRRSGKRRMRPAKAETVELSSELTTLQMALVRGHRWRDMLDQGEVPSMKEIAEKENIDFSYVSRMINMTMLSPDIIEAILDDTIPDLTVEEIAIAPPDLWDEQLRKLKLHRTLQGLVRHP